MEYVGIVLISHSSKIAEGLKDLIHQVLKDVPVEVAGGTEENDIGTSLGKVSVAIERAYSEKGVLLFYDLGSALMNAEMAIEMLEYDNVKIANGVPLVEGSYVATVESSLGKTLDEVLQAVQNSGKW